MIKKLPKILTLKAEELKRYYGRKDSIIASMVIPCFLNTIETTVQRLEDGSYFVITGDIPAMWLRDSAAQVSHYVRYAKDDVELRKIIAGIIAKQIEFVCLDPYANAFNSNANGAGHKDNTAYNPHIWERKYEIDSLCAPLYLSYSYWKHTGDTEIFTEPFRNMIRKIVEVWSAEQYHDTSPYFFTRETEIETDTLSNNGLGEPTKYTGMTWSGFRPSDDRCTYGYLIPSNFMAARALNYAEEMLSIVFQDNKLANECKLLAMNIEAGIEKYGLVEHPVFGKIYAYETDGYGNYNLMDDANVPSLLSLPYLDCCDMKDPIYQNTRKFILSEHNPYYKIGKVAKGVGSPHTPKGMIWHIGIIVQALTTDNEEEIQECIKMLSLSHAKTYLMHEAFNPDNPDEYTRPWFAWANSLFAELLIRLYEKDIADFGIASD